MVKKIIVVPEKNTFDIQHMHNLLDLVSKIDHPHGQACCSGDPLEFLIEEKFIADKEKLMRENAKILKLDEKQGKLIEY